MTSSTHDDISTTTAYARMGQRSLKPAVARRRRILEADTP